jgi:transposase
MTSRGPDRRHSTAVKLQLCQDIRAGVIGRRDAQRSHNISANLIQLWLTQFDRGELTHEEAQASVITGYETSIAALERKVGQLTMELVLFKVDLHRLCSGQMLMLGGSLFEGHAPCRPHL